MRPRDNFDRVKKASDCPALFQELYPDYYRNGGNSLCPFHGDSDASFSLHSKESVKCHGNCQRSFDAIDLWQAYHQCSTREALEALASKYGVVLDDAPTQDRECRRDPSPPEPNEPQNDWTPEWQKLHEVPLSREALDYFCDHRAIPQTILDELAVNNQIGFSPKWGEHGAVCFPVTDWNSREIKGYQRVPVGGGLKKFARRTRSGDAWFKVGNGGDLLVITEAIIDCLSIYAACKKDGLFLDVASTLSASTWRKIFHVPKGTFPILFFDGDLAGLSATINTVLEASKKRAVIAWADWSIVEGWSDGAIKDANDLKKLGRDKDLVRLVKRSRSASKPEQYSDGLRELLDQAQLLVDRIQDEQGRERAQEIVNDLRQNVEAGLGEIGGGEKDKDPIERRIEEINKTHAVVMLGTNCVIMEEYEDRSYNNRQSIQFLKKQDFINFRANEHHFIMNGNGKAKKMDIGTLWWESPNRRQYQSVVFAPEAGPNDLPGYYNLFRGFAVQPKQGDWSLMQQHIYNVLSGGHQRVFNYILAWCADLFQNPGGTRAGTALVFRGPQGAGKGVFVSQLGEIVGSHYLHISSGKRLTGNFNSHLKDALLVFCDEAIWAGDKQAEGVLKSMVTEPYNSIEPKGKDVFWVKNHIRLVVASNNDWVIPAGIDERRFCVMDVKNLYDRDPGYFKPLWDQMNNGGREAMLYDLLRVCLDKFNLLEFPRTEALFDQAIMSAKTSVKFWYEILRRGTLRPDITEWESYRHQSQYRAMCRTSEIHDDYVLFSQRIGDRYPSIDKVFSKDIYDMCPSAKRVRVRTTDNGLQWMTEFPPLEIAREEFKKFFKHELIWDKEDSIL